MGSYYLEVVKKGELLGGGGGELFEGGVIRRGVGVIRGNTVVPFCTGGKIWCMSSLLVVSV